MEVGLALGVVDGAKLKLGSDVGMELGTRDGIELGFVDGIEVGFADGTKLMLGFADGIEVGCIDGLADGQTSQTLGLAIVLKQHPFTAHVVASVSF